jgi:c-di-GMP-binding flagellar brake protein YcgR
MEIGKWIRKDRGVNVSPSLEGDTWFVSRISAASEASFSIATPIEWEISSPIAAGDKIRLQVPTPEGLLQFSSEVRKMARDPDARIELDNPKEVVHLERRAYPRLPVQIDTQYAEIRDGGSGLTYSRSTALDISGGGLRLETNRICPQETLVRVKFQIPLEKMEEELILTGRIVRSIPVAGARRSQVGVEFIDITPRQQKFLVQYILSRTKESRPDA